MSYTGGLDNPELYFQTKLYTGNGSSGTAITLDGSENMQPDFIWGACRSHADNHWMTDSVRGNTKAVFSNGDFNDETSSERIKSFDSDGFTIGNAGDTNTNTRTYCTWNWKAGTSFSNSAGANGADLASTGSYNRTAGFSIVTFTGNATANQQIYHGLNSVPKWMLLKNRTNSNNESWCVYHENLGNTKKLTLNTTATANTDTEFWQDTTPTSTVFTVGRQDAVNGSGNTHVVYLFSEVKGYSKFGSYTGIGSADGSFIFTGFRPSFIIVRDPNNAENWPMYDNKRPGFNVTNNHLFANDTAEETASTANIMDFLSNGFKIRSTNNGLNRSGGTFLYAAFAESPFVNSNGVPNNAR
tara:strand:+ start:2119 stop:3186 length:1068 start_codon:yes stop_codon:yes gene_type:complete